MQVVENFHFGSDLILIKDRIIIGLRDLNIFEINRGIKNRLEEDVIEFINSIYTGKSNVCEIMCFINHKNPNVRMAIAKYGHDVHRGALVNDECLCIRYFVAKYGNNEHRKQLINDENELVREMARKLLEGNEKYDTVKNPKHYCNNPSGVECKNVIKYLDYPTGAAIKYLWRHEDKYDNDINKQIEDLEKAKEHIDMKISILKDRLK